MANEQIGARWVLDTFESVVSAGTFLRLKSVFWAGNTDSDVVVLHDANGKEIWKAGLTTVATAGKNVSHTFGGEGIIVDGLDLDSIASSTILYVYLGKL